MRLHFPLFIVFFFIFKLPIFALDAKYKINLEIAVNLAVTHSYKLKASQAAINVAQNSSNAAFRSFAPNISATGTNIWEFENSNKNSVAPRDQYLKSQGQLTVTQPILGLVTLMHNLNQKEVSLKIAQEMEKSNQIQAALLGAQYYLNVQLALAQLSISQANLTTIAKSKEDAQTLYQTGSIYKDDYLRILLQFNQAQQSLTAAQSHLIAAQFILAQSLGIPNPDDMQIEPQSNSNCESKNINLPDLEQAKQEALLHNKDIQIADKNLELAKANRVLGVDNYLPALNAVAIYTKNFNDYSVNHKLSPDNIFAYGFQLNWNIWDWGVRSAENTALIEQISQQENLFEEQKEAILNNVVSQYYAIKNSLSAVKTAQESVSTSDETFSLVSYRFLNGQLSAFDLITAQQNLATSKADLAQARFNLDLAWITFQTILGKLPSV